MGAMVNAGHSILLWLTGLTCLHSETTLSRAMGQYRWPIALVSAALTADEEKAKAALPGSEFTECADVCPEMTVVPAGTFRMGSPEDEPDRDANEGPKHEVTIGRPFAVSKFEVTFEQWDACAAAASCPQVADHWGRGKMPVINVSWDDARQYIAWLSRLTGKQYRLMSEAEWEYAARAGTNTRYYWGNDARKGDANCNGCGGHWTLEQTAPVGWFKPNAFGLYDMHGNVWEWIEDRWHETYDGAPTDGTAWIDSGDPDFRIARGGAWRNESERVRAAARVDRHRKVAFDTLGFRVARTLAP